jgi:hypothetical protein
MATLANPGSGQVTRQTDLNSRGFIDVTYATIGGQAIDPASIAKGGQFTLSDGGDTLTLVGSPVALATAGSYRYFFTGYGTGTVTPTFIAGSWQNTGGTLSTAADFPTSSAYHVTTGVTWIDVTLQPTDNAQVDVSSVTTGVITLSGAGVGSLVAYTGTSPVLQISPAGQPGPATFRFLYTGAFASGTVSVAVAGGASSWSDTEGNHGVASTASFSVIAAAQSFYIELSGGLLLQDPSGQLGQPLLSVTADVKLEIDPVNKVFKLTFSGLMNVIELGNVGATSGEFVLDLSNGLSNGLDFWGAATLQTNFDVLKPYGINLYATGTLQINTSGTEHSVQLTLPIGPGNSNVTDTYDLQPYSFSLVVGGLAEIRAPGTTTDLVRLEGGFDIEINPQQIILYATAQVTGALVNYGQGTGLIIIQTGLTPGRNPGIAGYLTVSKTKGLGLPGVGTLITITGTATLMFNTTLQDQVFNVPAALIPVLGPNDPRTITIFAAAPGPDGKRNPNAPPGGEVYVSAAIQATVVIGGAINLVGFIQIQAAAGSSGVRLSVTGAVGTQIPFLGSLSGQIELTVFIGASPGVVGRVFLTLNAS